MTETKERGNIMVVDDTPANLKILQEVLQIKGYRVLAFSDGKMAGRRREARARPHHAGHYHAGDERFRGLLTIEALT
ncbi:MAG: hypothetical protein WCK00_05895 [Deltaproteobacteria bacterium]